jgi:uncharacterized membrane protein YphA (DoxX/SURF4 family)
VVGGFSVEGHPGIEFSMLLLACLTAVAWTYWPRREPKPEAAKTSLQIIRVASALSLLAHGFGPFALLDFTGMRGWGEYMTQQGWPCGVALVWSIKWIELISSILRLVPRLVVIACFGHLSYLVPALWIEHRLAWFNVGAGENGMEYPLLIILCSIACILAYWPRSMASEANEEVQPPRAAQPLDAE